MSLLTISGSPHVHGSQSVKKIMWGVVIALIPAMLVSFWYFGIGAILVTLVSVVSCLLFEYLIQKYIMKVQPTITDGSAVITGVLLAFNVPSSLPLWIVVIGALVAIGVAKMTYGGLGKNPFNPALVGRVFLLISFGGDMTSWPVPGANRTVLVDAVTGPTALGVVKNNIGKIIEKIDTLANGSIDTVRHIVTVSDIQAGKVVIDGEVVKQFDTLPNYVDQLMGNMGGSLGEVSALALIIGGLFMLFRKIITWHIPVSYLLSVTIFSGILWLINPEQYLDPVFHILTGGMLLGAIFMATDMVTSPMSKSGMLLFGLGCGVLTMLIRIWGAYPEGVSFAILIMNAFVPLINRGLKPKKFGEVIKNG